MEPGNHTQVAEFFSVWILRRDRAAGSPFWAVPALVPDHLLWEPSHYPDHCRWLPPPHTHVFLPLQPILYRHLFHLHVHSKDAVECPDKEQSQTYEDCLCQLYFLVLFKLWITFS